MVAPVSLWRLVAAPCPLAWSAGTWGLSHAMQNRRAAVVFTLSLLAEAVDRQADGLTSLGGNQWAETSTSGQPTLGTPNTGSLGTLQSNAVEESNVDLTSELVKMITQQRNYQANAQSIKTQDQIMQTLVNIR